MNAVEDIRKIRAVFIRGALSRLMDRIARGDFEDTEEAARELGPYFEQFKQDFQPGTREHLARQLETLIEASGHLTREYAAESADRISSVAPTWGKLYLVPR